MNIILVSVISVLIGFGSAFYLEQVINSRLSRKSQRVLSYIAMISFGIGFSGLLLQIISHQTLGLIIDYKKVVSYVVINMLGLPASLYLAAWLIGLIGKGKEPSSLGAERRKIEGASKYFAVVVGCATLAYIGYAAFEAGSGNATYDFYEKVDYKNCDSPYESAPAYSLRFTLKKGDGRHLYDCRVQ